MFCIDVCFRMCLADFYPIFIAFILLFYKRGTMYLFSTSVHGDISSFVLFVLMIVDSRIPAFSVIIFL